MKYLMKIGHNNACIKKYLDHTNIQSDHVLILVLKTLLD